MVHRCQGDGPKRAGRKERGVGGVLADIGLGEVLSCVGLSIADDAIGRQVGSVN